MSTKRGAIGHLCQSGWLLREAGYRSRVIIDGKFDGRDARFEWSGGIFGVSCRFVIGAQETTCPVLSTKQEIVDFLTDFQITAN